MARTLGALLGALTLALATTGCGSEAPASSSGAAGDKSTANTADREGEDPSGAPSAASAGNPDGACRAALPARAKPVDTSQPTSVVGSGTADSCTHAALEAAIAKAGVITFDCGAVPATILVTQTLELATDRDTVIDGGGKVTLDGGDAVRILRFENPDFRKNDHGLTLQHLTLTRGRTTPQEAIPEAPAPCSQGFNDGEGGALYLRDGSLTVIDSIFTDNHGAELGPDTGGGAIYALASKAGVVIAHSTFDGNSASNGGGVGALFSELSIYDSSFTNNRATGNGANNNEPDKCSAMNNGQNETGSGGNGGPIYSDGNSVNVTLCGDKIVGNQAGDKAFGGGLFFTSNDMNGTLLIADTIMTGNTGGSWTNTKEGDVKSAGSAVGTNCKSIRIESSTLQGVP